MENTSDQYSIFFVVVDFSCFTVFFLIGIFCFLFSYYLTSSQLDIGCLHKDWTVFPYISLTLLQITIFVSFDPLIITDESNIRETGYSYSHLLHFFTDIHCTTCSGISSALLGV
jgi:hypothetical protein